MIIDPKFEDLFKCGEQHDIINFNRRMIDFLSECISGYYDLELITEDLEKQFKEANLCSVCETQLEMVDDQIIIDGQRIFLKVCPSCNYDFEV